MSQWTCPTCTFYNDNGLACKMCRTAKPDQNSDKKQWNCTCVLYALSFARSSHNDYFSSLLCFCFVTGAACTLQNPLSHDQCSACGTARRPQPPKPAPYLQPMKQPEPTPQPITKDPFLRLRFNNGDNFKEFYTGVIAAAKGIDKSTIFSMLHPLVTKLQEGDIDHLLKTTRCTALVTAVKYNCVDSVRALLDLGASINVTDENGETPLNHAVANESFDGTEIARVLLSKGADYSSLESTKLPTLTPDHKDFNPKLLEENLTLQYWLTRAREIYPLPINEERKADLSMFGLQGVDEIQFGIIGERHAVRMIINSVNAFYSTPTRTKPLVLMLPGPPGHGKTFLTRNLALALVGKNNLLEIACGGLRDDAELFGSNLGGMGGARRSEGKLVTFLRDCQDRKARSVVFLDEFEKIKGLVSALGWGQAKKMYQGFLEPWQEGTLSDASSNSSPKISCKDTIFICTTNLGQEEIITFAKRNSQRLQQESREVYCVYLFYMC